MSKQRPMKAMLACAVMAILMSLSARAQGWQAAATSALQTSLRAEFPAVAEWQTAPLISRHQQETLDRSHDLAPPDPRGIAGLARSRGELARIRAANRDRIACRFRDPPLIPT